MDSPYTAHTPDENGLIRFSDAENAVWRDLSAQQAPKVRKHMAQPYLEGLERLALPAARIPQAGEISAVLTPLTGWRMEWVPAVIPFGRFYAMLADKAFPAASFIRSREDFTYVKEPDIFHEIFGHTPLLTDPRFAAFTHAIGRMGLRASPGDYSWLIRLYWFTIEFGLTIEAGRVKALGSGLASSPTELIHAVSGDMPERRPFDIIDILRTPYRIDIHQPIYYVLEDLDDLFRAAERDLLADVHKAQALGLFEPVYEVEQRAS